MNPFSSPKIQLLILLLHFFTQCKSIAKKTDLLPIPNPPYQENECRKSYPLKSSLYPTNKYAGNFQKDETEYKTIILGDSTLDYIRRFPEYHSDQTQNLAVAGNTLCDILEQLPAIKSKSPEAIIISTGGGNDLIRKIPTEIILQTGNTLFQELRMLFPKTKLILAGVHPTRLNHVNANRKLVNSGFAKKVDCYVDTEVYFQVDQEGKPGFMELLDQVHYSKDIAFRIREGFIQCGAEF